MKLRFAEEIILLLLEDEGGRFVRVPSWSMNYALAGAVLMDLAMEDRIDTDLESLLLIDSTPVGDSLLDPTLAEIAAGEPHDTRHWVERTGGASRRYPGGGALPAGRPWHPGTPRRATPVGVPFQALPCHRWTGGARGQAPHHGSALQRRDPRPPRRDDHLLGRRMQHIQRAPVPGASSRGRPTASSRSANSTS